MSAIFGILAFAGRSAEFPALERMGRALSHRAPDGFRHWHADGIALGHGLMSVTREDGLDRQPLVDSDLVLAADLRLDNRAELAQALGIDGEQLRKLSDGALLREAYRKWGEDCVNHLLGDFAFAIWDVRKQQLVLARDHMGQRNCFFHHGADHFLFASEIKALWAIPTVPRALSDAAIAVFLVHDRSPDAGLPFEGIECLAGGERMVIEANGSIRRETYWQPVADPAHVGRSDQYYVEAYRQVLGEAVACRIRRANSPVALFMSGGFDSAAIAALAAEPLAGRQLIAVTSAMPQEYSGTILHARKWVEMCARVMPHINVRYVTLDGADPLEGTARRFLQDDMRSQAYGFVAQALYMAAAQSGARSVLTGYGGEVTLNPRGNLIAQLLVDGHWWAFFRELRARSRATGVSLWGTFKTNVIAPLWPEGVRRWGRQTRQRSRLVEGAANPGFIAEMASTGGVRIDELRQQRSRRNYLDRRIRALRRKANMPAPTGLAYAAGLEQSDPFYDKRVVELALAIPSHIQLRNGRERDLARRSLADLYPPEFQSRSRWNDDMLPDFQRMVKAIEPRILAELERMERSGKLGRYFDFDEIRRLLAARGADDHDSGWEQETQLALDGYLTARYIEWFRGYN